MFWSGLKELNELSKKICEDFSSFYPASLQGESRPHARKQLVAALLSVDHNIGRFLAANPRPGVFKKAKCANEVKWGLREKGFQRALVDAVTHKVLLGLARTPSGLKAKSGNS